MCFKAFESEAFSPIEGFDIFCGSNEFRVAVDLILAVRLAKLRVECVSSAHSTAE
jgi:hypothetical protein